MSLHKFWGILLSTIFHNQLLPFLASSSHALFPPLQVHHTAECYWQILDSTIPSLVSLSLLLPVSVHEHPSLPCMFNFPLTFKAAQVPCTLGSSPRTQSASRDSPAPPQPPPSPQVPRLRFHHGVHSYCSFLTLLPVRLRIWEQGLSFSCLSPVPVQGTHQTRSWCFLNEWMKKLPESQIWDCFFEFPVLCLVNNHYILSSIMVTWVLVLLILIPMVFKGWGHFLFFM